MPSLIWTPAALKDLQRLHHFLREHDATAARSAIKRIRDAIKILALQPGAGRPIPELPSEFREWVIDFGRSGYIALYRRDGDRVLILAVRHQSEAGY